MQLAEQAGLCVARARCALQCACLGSLQNSATKPGDQTLEDRR